MKQFTKKITIKDLEPEILTGDSYDFYLREDIIGSYNRCDSQDNNELSNELYETAMILSRLEQCLATSITIKFFG